MQIFDQYLCRELLKTASVVLLVLILIICGNTLLRIVADVVNGELPRDYIFSLLAVSIIRQITILIPFAFFIGITLVLGRMYQENEIYAVHSGGVGALSLMRKLLWVLLPLLILMLWFALVVNPWAKNYQDEIWRDSQQRLDINTVVPGQFNLNNNQSSVLFFEQFGLAEDALPETMENVFISANRNAQLLTQSSATASKYIDSENGNLYLLYENGQMQIQQTQSSAPEGYTVIEFDRHAILLKEKVTTANRSSRVSAIPSSVLLNSDKPSYQAELQFRLAIPLGAFLLLLLAVPLSRIQPRKGRYAKVGNAILIFFLFFYVVNLMAAWLAEGKLPSVPGLFISTIVLLIVLFIYIAIFEGWRLTDVNKNVVVKA